MMTKPIKTLKFRYPMIQLLIILDIPQFSVSWGILGHVTRLDQSRASEKIWWIVG